MELQSQPTIADCAHDIMPRYVEHVEARHCRLHAASDMVGAAVRPAMQQPSQSQPTPRMASQSIMFEYVAQVPVRHGRAHDSVLVSCAVAPPAKRDSAATAAAQDEGARMRGLS